ncbi:uncharacterized protein N7496_007450 [Penicillium cataractarum]|uniref:BHLH domain-containing protein n=1 Tax=Penicillium cataractarum TaxID=2100454 RepID=A0A9W9S3G1_9EURO|nr:uncharacterized protein N7496_007450 [Penicillium cataractarum]KAJ5371358.1 hypothetical protein N7496_007450 [Penicillium cataractarum]
MSSPQGHLQPFFWKEPMPWHHSIEYVAPRKVEATPRRRPDHTPTSAHLRPFPRRFGDLEHLLLDSLYYLLYTIEPHAELSEIALSVKLSVNSNHNYEMASQTTTHQSKPKRRGRPRPLPPDVNARNLALEKGRREDMKKDLLELARLVPSLAPVRRLSKTIVVKEGLQHFKKQRAMCLSAAEDMRDLVAENHRLVAELNELRFLAGERNTPPLEPKPISEAMVQLMNVPNEVCGTFPAGFGDNWAYGSHDTRPDQSNNDPTMDQAVYCSPADDIPLAVEPPTQNQMPDDSELAASSVPFPEYPLSGETLSQSSLNCSLSPHTPDLSHTSSHQGLIPGMTQLDFYTSFDTQHLPTVPLDTIPIDVSAALWMQGIGMPESAQSTLCGNTGTVGGKVGQEYMYMV